MSNDPWGEDRLNFKARGETFTNLIKSIDDSKVISIEAGFGRGKTFFRKAWAEHLRNEGEIVIEIDAQQSDHSGDPVVTFIGALVEALGPDEKTRLQKTKEAGLKYTAVAARTVAKAVLRQGADELIGAVQSEITEGEETSEILKTAVEGIGSGMSKFAGEMIAAQLTAEKARTKELPEQLLALRKALTEDVDTDRVVILVDELDRCHPDYAIALLEAMKLVFDQDGFVFVLMANPEYLKRIAEHRFGRTEEGEEYLEKFVDIRLSLGATNEVIGEAARGILLRKCKVGVPFGIGPAFGIEAAADLTAELAQVSRLSMRQIEKVILKVELALRCYRNVPVDASLLVQLAFKSAAKEAIRSWSNANRQGSGRKRRNAGQRLLPLYSLPECSDLWPVLDHPDGRRFRTRMELGKVTVVEMNETMSGLPLERYRIQSAETKPPPNVSETDGLGLGAEEVLQRNPSGLVKDGILPWYQSEHQAMLDAVHGLQPDDF